MARYNHEDDFYIARACGIPADYGHKDLANPACFRTDEYGYREFRPWYDLNDAFRAAVKFGLLRPDKGNCKLSQTESGQWRVSCNDVLIGNRSCIADTPQEAICKAICELSKQKESEKA